MRSVLLVDDEQHILHDLGKYLEHKRFTVHMASTITDAEKVIKSEDVSFAIVDLKIDYSHEYGGIHIVNYIKKMQPRVKTIILSAYPLNDQIASNISVDIDGYIEKGGDANYILSVLNKIDEIDRRHSHKVCFVIMPFSETKTCNSSQWTEIFDKMIKPAVEEAGYNYICRRSEAIVGNIIDDILDELNRADLVIADLTDKNPNVFYELGVRHALRDATILIAQSIKDVPFDLRPYAIQAYDWTIERNRELFKDRIKQIIRAIELEPQKATSPGSQVLADLGQGP